MKAHALATTLTSMMSKKGANPIMKKRIFLLPLLLLLLGSVAWAGDTGTYRILDYKVTLTPHSDGQVDIQYYQKWLVTSGHIPWITVGLPNSQFGITGYGQAVKTINPANEGGWSGVRLDLDKDYKPNQTFEISFKVVQRKLFYADKEKFRLDFTPGWYDRALTDTLSISLVCFAPIDSVKTKPSPTSVVGKEITWVKHKLGQGEQFSISASFPKRLFPAAAVKAKQGSSDVVLIVFLVIFGIVILIIIIAFATSGGGYSGGGGGLSGSDDDDDHYSGGSIFVGGSSGSSSSSSSSRSTGGGGGFGGRSSSCVCACVACACACACAGGGGAGCSRKTDHTCPLCQEGGS